MSFVERILCAGLLALVPCTLRAQEPEPDVLALDSLLNTPIDASGKYQRTAREAASSVTIITHEQIEHFGYWNLGAALLHDGVRVAYVTPLRAVPTSDVAAATREHQVVSVTGVVQYVEEGLAVAVDAKGERPQIVINLAASRAEGAAFAGQLLKLARLTGPEVSDP
ncbi:MAG: YfiR/HmsC family protein [Gemmatimonadales bacterium]